MHIACISPQLEVRFSVDLSEVHSELVLLSRSFWDLRCQLGRWKGWTKMKTREQIMTYLQCWSHFCFSRGLDSGSPCAQTCFLRMWLWFSASFVQMHRPILVCQNSDVIDVKGVISEKDLQKSSDLLNLCRVKIVDTCGHVDARHSRSGGLETKIERAFWQGSCCFCLFVWVLTRDDAKLYTWHAWRMWKNYLMSSRTALTALPQLLNHILWVQEEPVASGSVGQVHRARLRAEHALDGPGVQLVTASYSWGVKFSSLFMTRFWDFIPDFKILPSLAPGGNLRDVAVKIQHPGVIDSAFMDLNIVPQWHFQHLQHWLVYFWSLRSTAKVWKIVEFSEKFLHMTMPFDRSRFLRFVRSPEEPFKSAMSKRVLYVWSGMNRT